MANTDQTLILNPAENKPFNLKDWVYPKSKQGNSNIVIDQNGIAQFDGHRQGGQSTGEISVIILP